MAHDGAEGAASGNVSVIEGLVALRSKGLVESIATEESAQVTFEEQTTVNELEELIEEKTDDESKTKEPADLDKAVFELSNAYLEEQTQVGLLSNLQE